MRNITCKTCINLMDDWCNKVVDSPDKFRKRDCQYYKTKTNADRIRRMTDEELAEWLHNMCDFEEDDEPYKSIYDIDADKEEAVRDSYGDILEWLQKEAEE